MKRYGTLSDTTIPTTKTDKEETRGFSEEKRVCAILAAYVPDKSAMADRCIVEDSLLIGRGDECGFPILDTKISKRHARVHMDDGGAWIEDLGSTNGTFVQGERLVGRRRLADGAVIRAGSSVLVYHSDAGPLMQATGTDTHGFVGPFHTATMLKNLKEATASRRHILFVGPSGAGKELAARAVAKMLGKNMRVHNAARFTSEEEAMATLFGVGRRVFSNVDPRPGLIEQAQDNLLFLDEIHNLPERVQRSLLRIVEDSEYERIGDSKASSIDLRFVFASNAPGPFHGLAKDLYARVLKVSLPGLNDRVADIPTLFTHLLHDVGGRYGLDVGSLAKRLSSDHFEALCLADYTESNVRGLADIADRLVVKMKTWGDEEAAVTEVFTEHFGGSAVGFRPGQRFNSEGTTFDLGAARQMTTRKDNPEDHHLRDSAARKKLVIEAYRKTSGNVSAIERHLRDSGVNVSRKWISSMLDDLGLPRLRKRGGE